MPHKRPGNIFALRGYWERYVNRLTDCRYELRTLVAMGNYQAASVVAQEMEQIQNILEPPRAVTPENRWDFMLKSNRTFTDKMDTQGL